MDDNTTEPFGFPAIGRKKVAAAFDGGRLTSDGGVMLLAAAKRHLGLCDRLAGYCQVVGLMDAFGRAARHLSCLRGHLDARLLPPDPEGLGTGIAVLSSRHQVPPRTEMAIDHRVG